MRIEIHSFNGVHFNLDVKESDTVKEVKQKIRLKENYDVSEQILIYKYEKLNDDSKTLLDYQITDGASLQLRIPGELKIKVELMNDLVISLEMDPNYTVGHITFAIEHKTQMRYEIQRLFLKGKELQASDFIRETGIYDGCVLVCRPQMEIIINISGKKIAIGTKEDDLVKEIKFQIRVMEELRFAKQSLVFNRKELDDNKELSHYGIVDGSVIDLFEKPYTEGEYINIVVATQDGKIMNFKVDSQSYLLELKLAIQHKYRIAFRQIRLVFNGRTFDDYETFQDHNVQDGDAVEMFQCLCGC
uniref:Ubiquitin-like domain-containing protein n=1 Tax=Panagrolaimus davidi TaxID=227884 RepID=A0A914QLS8_9BILA